MFSYRFINKKKAYIDGAFISFFALQKVSTLLISLCKISRADDCKRTTSAKWFNSKTDMGLNFIKILITDVGIGVEKRKKIPLKFDQGRTGKVLLLRSPNI